MTHKIGGILDGSIVVWPEHDTPEKTLLGHAIVVMPNHDCITLIQRDQDVIIPYYGLGALIEALTTLKEAHEFYEHLDRKDAKKRRRRRP
ncbi:hypothetical protein RBI14_15390 [Alcaligenaceae bacterium B3P038]|nr:hypothetical protein [Alcaligenaceae bacterium B3P038]